MVGIPAKILIVEDDLNKLNNLEKFILKYFKTKNIEIIIQIKNLNLILKIIKFLKE